MSIFAEALASSNKQVEEALNQQKKIGAIALNLRKVKSTLSDLYNQTSELGASASEALLKEVVGFAESLKDGNTEAVESVPNIEEIKEEAKIFLELGDKRLRKASVKKALIAKIDYSQISDVNLLNEITDKIDSLSAADEEPFWVTVGEVISQLKGLSAGDEEEVIETEPDIA